MDTIKKLFPLSFNTKDLVAFIIRIVIYLAAPSVVGFIVSLLSGIPVLGLILGIISWAFGIYCFVGLVLLILAYVKVIK